MFSITKRLEQAQQAAYPKQHQEAERAKAGRNAECAVLADLRLQSGIDSSSIFCSLRVPDEYQTRRREIDIVLLVSSGVVCIEVKNWGGNVKSSEDKTLWIQTKNRKVADQTYVSNIIEHDNGAAVIKTKAFLLKDHLARNGVYISDKQLKYYIVFVNKNCALESQISENQTVITSDKSVEFIQSFKRGYLEAIQDTVTPSFLSGNLSFSQITSARSVLSSIGTWDIVELHGGKRLYGDYKDCPGISLDRSKIEALEISHQRNYTIGMAWAAIGYTPSVCVSLLERHGSGWLWNAYRAVVKIPYDTEIVFRVCGDDMDSKISVNEIVRVKISI